MLEWNTFKYTIYIYLFIYVHVYKFSKDIKYWNLAYLLNISNNNYLLERSEISPNNDNKSKYIYIYQVDCLNFHAKL